ncbi:MAG TPA: PKD domain-containing protein, partial [Candidatus Limnocylindrales bacterium]|nr:PKD domain-containing protein [Candidatus Limnocylindrales bacterium]
RFEGMTTDPTRLVHLYGIDLDPTTGVATDRDWGTIGVDPGAPNGAVKGRWRFRPPCTASVATDKACTPPPGGTFLPPTREVRAVIEGQQSQGCPTASVCSNPASPVSNTALKSANGLVYGQYHAPILEYIFPENVPGTPIVENNFNAIQFLAQGGYTSSAGTLAGQLNPWPSNVTPAPACLTPTANAGGPYTVASGGTVQLSGSASGSTPLAFAWTVSSGSLANAGTATPTFSAVGATSPVTVTLTVSNGCGSATVTSSITVNPLGTPTVNSIAPQSVFSGASGSFVVTGSDPNVPAQNLTFSVAQTGTPALLNLAVTSTSSTSATITFVAPTLPIGQVTPATVTLSVTATNSGSTSAPVSTTVTINPLADAVAVTSAEYRTGKQRLILNASSSVVSPNVVLKLQPYLTTNGTTYNPDPAAGGVGNVFTNNGGGLYILDMVGAPRPACNPTDATLYATPCSLAPLDVKSNLGGDSGPVRLTRIRQ